MRTRFAVLAALLFTNGCATVAQQIDTSVIYRADIRLKINGQEAVGVIVVPKAASYTIEGHVKGLFDFLLARSCHREISWELHDDDFRYVYQPIPGLEDGRECPLEFEGVEKVKARDSSALIEFEDPAYQMPATTICNGESKATHGVSACQAKVGLFQRIIFPVPVLMAAPNPICRFPEPADHMTFEFPMASGKCLYVFREIGPERREHRFRTRGYDQIILRDI